MLKTAPKKEPVEVLQEKHLSGPADEPMHVVAKELQDGEIVFATQESARVENVVFRNQRDPGTPLEFHFASATHPFKQYKLFDGHTYVLPVEVIRNLEQSRENVEKYRKNADGVPEVYVAGYKTHFVCERV
jgi:hypothetical protein